MKRTSNFFYQKSTFLIAVALTVLTFGYLFFVMMDVAKCFELMDSSIKSLGTSFGFSQSDVQEFFSARSTEQVNCYIGFNLIWDNVFAILYGLMYATWLSLLLKSSTTKYKLINLLPLAQTLFDWLENFSLASSAKAFLADGTVPSLAAKLGSIFSMAKWSCSGLTFVLLILGIVLLVQKKAGKNRLQEK